MTVRKYCNLAALGVALTTCVAMPALATESGAYLGVNIGQANFDIDAAEIEDLFISNNGPNLDNSDTAYSLAVGYRFTPYFAVEASYLEMGEASASEAARERLSASTTLDYATEFAASANGLAVALIGTIPAGNFEFNARFGFFLANTEVTYEQHASLIYTSFPTQTYNDSFNESASTTETLYGLGMGYTFGDHFHIQADWVMVQDVGDETTGEDDVTLLTAGMQYRF